MKKYSLKRSPLLIGTLVALLFMACQKEQSSAGTDSAATMQANGVTLVSGNGVFAGTIDASYADALAKNFATRYNKPNQTLRIAFSSKDLISFLQTLQSKQKSNTIYVNFGLYGGAAPAPDSKDDGRMTVFFTGNNLSKKQLEVRLQLLLLMKNI